jgi:NlpC/P60 family putative phage cell wall peptidase
MTFDGTTIVEAARGWIGTPYVHQSSVRGAGADCLGLIRGVWRDLSGSEPEAVPPYTADWSEPQKEEALWAAAARHLEPIDIASASPGDILLLRMREGNVAKHLGILGEVAPAPTLIHAYSRHGVLESPLSAPWKRRVVAAFRFPRGRF